jgi:hypothetical protein
MFDFILAVYRTHSDKLTQGQLVAVETSSRTHAPSFSSSSLPIHLPYCIFQFLESSKHHDHHHTGDISLEHVATFRTSSFCLSALLLLAASRQRHQKKSSARILIVSTGL